MRNKNLKSTQLQAKRETAATWYRQYRGVHMWKMFALKNKGFTYCEIMDYFAGKGLL